MSHEIRTPLYTVVGFAELFQNEHDKSDEPVFIDQIKQKNYPAKLADYTGDILLVGINYDKESKQHTCKIESVN